MKKKKEQRKIILENTFLPNNASISSKAPVIHKEEEKIQKNHINHNTNHLVQEVIKNDKINNNYSNIPKKSVNNNNNNIITNTNPYNKQPSIKGKPNVLSNNNVIAGNQINGVGSQMKKNAIENNLVSDKNYNFINNNKSAMGGGNQSIGNKPSIIKESDKNHVNNTNQGPKNILNNGIVYRNTNNTPSMSSKKPFGKI